jgi:hypothetical protein
MPTPSSAELESRLREAEARAAAAERELAIVKARDSIIEAAEAEAFEYPDLVPALVAGRLDVDGEGRVVDVRAVVRRLAREKPGLLKSGRPGPDDRWRPPTTSKADADRAREQLAATGRYGRM